MFRSTFVLVAAFAAVVAAAPKTRPSAPPPATRPATAPATRPAWTSVVFADPGDARRIVFVLDASGSMISKMAALKDEVTRAIDGLGPDQSFNLAFLQADETLMWQANGPVPATAANRRAACRFLDDVTTAGESDPAAVLRAAFRQKPDLVYFLTDDFFNGTAGRIIERLDWDHRTRVNTVAFLNAHDREQFKDLGPMLKAAARETGGSYREIDAEALEPNELAKGSKPVVELVAAGPAPAPLTRPTTRRTVDAPLGHLADAPSVVFVCDTSASMAEKLSLLKKELTAAVAALKPDQSFGIVLLLDVEGRPAALADGKLVKATDARKAEAAGFIQAMTPHGRGEPAGGLRRAFDMSPQQIILVGDGQFPDPHWLPAQTKVWNPEGRVRVDTVELVGPDDPPPLSEDADVLRRIAKANGGTFRWVDVEEPKR